MRRVRISVILGCLVILGGGWAESAHAQATLSFAASTYQVAQTPATITLTWEAGQVKRCAATGGWSGQKGAVGSQEITVTDTTTFTLVCTTAEAPISKSITVSVGAPAPSDRSGSPQPPAALSGEAADASSVLLSWQPPAQGSVEGYKVYRNGKHVASVATPPHEDIGLMPDTAYTYVVRTLGAGAESASSSPAVVRTRAGNLPEITFAATPAQIDLHDVDSLDDVNVTLSWDTAHAVNCTAGGGWSGSRASRGEEVVQPRDTTTYILTCLGESGSRSASVTVTFYGRDSAALSCSAIPSGGQVPQGFSAPYDVLGQTQELLLDVSCTARRAIVTAGNGSHLQMVYTNGYQYRGGVWEPIAFTGPQREGNWLVGAGKAELSGSETELGEFNYVVAYMCTWHQGRWKCGCRDATCAQGQWQLQAFRR